jgi:hypothetical protein
MTFDGVYDSIKRQRRTCYWTRGLRVMQIIEAAIQSSAQKSNQFIDKVKLSVHFTCNGLLA